MSHQFGWSSSEAGLVQSSFFWGYAVSHFPGGWLPKIWAAVLEIGVFTWSFPTALVPLLTGFMPGLIFCRILVGIGEGEFRICLTASFFLEAAQRQLDGTYMGLESVEVVSYSMRNPNVLFSTSSCKRLRHQEPHKN